VTKSSNYLFARELDIWEAGKPVSAVGLDSSLLPTPLILKRPLKLSLFSWRLRVCSILQDRWERSIIFTGF